MYVHTYICMYRVYPQGYKEFQLRLQICFLIHRLRFCAAVYNVGITS